MGRRRKRRKVVAYRPKRTIPNVFQCPYCGKIAITIESGKSENREKHAIIKCGNCGLQAEMNVPTLFQNVDIYGKFLDGFYSNTLNYTFIKASEEKSETEEAM